MHVLFDMMMILLNLLIIIDIACTLAVI